MRVLVISIALATGVAWAINYDLSFAAFGAVVASYLVAGLALAVVLPPLARRLCPGGERAGVALATWMLLGVLPVFHEVYAPQTLQTVPRLALVLGTAGATALVALGVARAGSLASAVVGVVALGAAFAVSPLSLERLPIRRTHVAQVATGGVSRLAVIGIDGGDWRVIDPLIEAGDMPNLAALRARGIHGVLTSIDPMYSPVVWSSIFSGKVPAKHGITGWLVSHAENRKAAMLWEIAEAAGLDAIVVDVPGTWPPSAIRGALVSGFPIPAVAEAGAASGFSTVGEVVQAGERHGLVPAAVATRASDGAFEASVRLGAVPTSARTRLRHWVIEHLALRGRMLPVEMRVPVRIGPTGANGEQSVQVGIQTVELAPGAWSPWLASEVKGKPIWFRVRRIEGGGLYVTPPFQDAGAPLYPFTNTDQVQSWVASGGLYIVEGTGWRAAVDPDLRDALYEHLADVSEIKFKTVVKLLQEEPDWRLLSYVFTLTDRVSHAFWPFHEPEAYPPIPEAELAASRSRVNDAYRWVDAQLGELLERLGPDVTVLVVSDHGFRANAEAGYGDHRKEGIFVAAGPGVSPSSVPVDLSILDVAPTVLLGLGLPVPGDMDGRAARAVFPNAPDVPPIASYETSALEPTVAPPKQIDPTTEEQLRSLGYIE